ncbi:hypothetical protein [Chryseobacterium taiwanense]|uniref:Uncharacterized protein n=1 Tax=Chryseobacterium taiwanense TaxID=363331 RepID=A0A0B4DEA0_9FLAO|nr:hypothetical protein [Chryseobacterium taiwanense]KIC62710.1 hypothetical protein RM51_10990 [Chryseobacterium taiwanense]
MNTDQIQTFDIEKAKKETSYWREFYKAKLSPESTEEDIFRGFRIPLADLEDILTRIKSYNSVLVEGDSKEKEIHSLRVYLAKKDQSNTKSDDIHVLLVPVAGGTVLGVNESEEPLVQEYGQDLLEMLDPGRLDLESAIYDFSTPCPQQCDKSSELYK